MLRKARKMGRLFESLEDRRMLAVTAAMLGGNLTIADNASDTFVVAGGATAGSVVITGVNGTTINGSSSATLSGFTGGVTMSLGSGNVSVSIADLTIAKGVTITGGAGKDTVDIGAIASAAAAAAPAADTVSIGGSLVVTLGGGSDTVTVGAIGGTTPDVTVGGTVGITVGGGNDTVTEDATTITGSESILTGTGTDSVLIGTGAATVTINNLAPTFKPAVITVKPATPTTPAGVNVAGSLVITVGTGNDTITEESLLVGATESIYMGSGADNVTIGPAVAGPCVMPASVTAAAITQLVDEGGVAVEGSLDVLLGSGNTSVSATDLSVGGTLLISGSPVNLGFNFGLGSDFGLGIGFGIGSFSFGFGLGSVPGGGIGGLFGTQTDTISLSDITLKMPSSSPVSVRPGWLPSKVRRSAP